MPAGNEKRRQACLQEMGIQVWYPRFILPQAPRRNQVPVQKRLTPQSSADEARNPAVETAADLSGEHSPVAVEQAMPVVTVPLAPTAPVTSVVPEPEANEVVAPAVSGASVPEGSPGGIGVATVPDFSFAYIPVSEGLAVLVDIPYAGRGRLQAPHRELLTRIIGALSIPVRSGSNPVIHFQWPLHEGDLDNNLESARQTVQGFLGRQLKERPIACMLVFSDTWPDYLFPAGSVVSGKSLVPHPTLPIEVLVTRSLQAMLEDESLKRPVWAQLQELKSRLGQLGGSGQ